MALKGGLKKYAREAIAQSDEAVRKAYPEVFVHLDIVAGEVFETLLKNKTYKKYVDELVTDSSKRAFKELLSVEEEAILKFYTTTEGYKDLNKALRGEIKLTDFYKAQERLMNIALDKLPSYKSKGLLYRIENLTDSQIKSIYKEGKTITNLHFTSATYDMFAIAEAMKKRAYTILIRIETKSGKLIQELSTKHKQAFR